MENKKLVILGLIVLVLLFYWFQVRPSKIRGYCDWVAWNDTKNRGQTHDYYDWKYTQCLHNQGLK